MQPGPAHREADQFRFSLAPSYSLESVCCHDEKKNDECNEPPAMTSPLRALLAERPGAGQGPPLLSNAATTRGQVRRGEWARRSGLRHSPSGLASVHASAVAVSRGGPHDSTHDEVPPCLIAGGRRGFHTGAAYTVVSCFGE